MPRLKRCGRYELKKNNMNLAQLPSITKRTKKRVGRGHGSGKGAHTVGRGTKGRRARGSVGPNFFGTAMGASYIKRLPLLRGKGKLKARVKPVGVNVSYLSTLPAKSTVDVALLVKHHILSSLDEARNGVKILGGGTITVALTVVLPATSGARTKIEKAGGTVEKVHVPTANTKHNNA